MREDERVEGRKEGRKEGRVTPDSRGSLDLFVHVRIGARSA